MNGYLIYIDLNNKNCYFNQTFITIQAKLNHSKKILHFKKLMINLESEPIRSKIIDFSNNKTLNLKNKILTNPFYLNIDLLFVKKLKKLKYFRVLLLKFKINAILKILKLNLIHQMFILNQI